MIEIIIPAYNCKKTLNRALASLECQTFTDFLVHLIDDCSDEDLSNIVNKHSGLNIRVTRHQKNLGCGMSRQTGMDQTLADYIAFLDSDDVLMPYTVETWHHMSDSAPEIDIFHSWFYEQAYINGNPALHIIRNGFTWCHGKLYKVDFLRKFQIRESPEVRWADDSMLNSQCTELGNVGLINFPLYLWINNSSSITRSKDGAFQLSGDKIDDFVHAMRLSTENVLKYKTNISHLQNTIKLIENQKEDIHHSYNDYLWLKERSINS